MTREESTRVRNSFVAGSLISSAGVFIAKMLGLFYVSPLNSLAGTQANLACYTASYNYYSVLLQICTAGLPYAVAAMIARYAARNDYRSVLLIRRLSLLLLSGMGFVCMLLFAGFSGPISSSVLSAQATGQDFVHMRLTFIILSLALFVVPILSSYRSFYQGLKQFRICADSQVVEQLVRIPFLLAAGWVCVYVFKLDRIWAIYMAVFSTSVGAAAALGMMMRYDKKNIGPVLRAARGQENDAVDKKQLIRELFAFGLPYLITAIFGNSQSIVNTQFFIRVATGLGMDYNLARDLLPVIQLQCDKLTSIPQVLGIGFSSGIVPFMTISLDQKNYQELRQNIRDCLNTVCYIAMPICWMLFALARPVYYILYGNTLLDYATTSMQWSALLALCTTLTPICTSMMLTLHLQKESILYLAVGFIVKCISFYPLMKINGYNGAISSSILCSASIIYLSLAKISSTYKVDYTGTLKKVIRILLCCLCMNATFVLLRYFGLSFSESSRVSTFGMLCLYGAIGGLTYLLISIKMKLPQSIFHVNFKELFSRLKSRRHKA